MSIPHTGKLGARIGNDLYRFNGDTWSGPDREVVEQLNEATAEAPVSHMSIRDRAEYVLRSLNWLGRRAEIQDWAADEWGADEDLPDGAID